jgi:hypothetical protein
MKDYSGRISNGKWAEIAARFGCGVTIRQLQERWHNFAKPGLDRSRLDIAERRTIAALAMTRSGDWKWIATQLPGGKRRSAAMVKHCATSLLPKLLNLGFLVEDPRDIDFVPDEAFEWGFPRGDRKEELIAEFRRKKALSTEAGRREAALARDPVDIYAVRSLLSRPPFQ